jgi:hypothetical protein
VHRLLLIALTALAATLCLPAVASASQLIVRDARSVSLKVGGKNRAVVSYYANGRWRHTIWWGAVNAKFPDPAHPKSQVRFQYDYSGGSGSFGAGYWKRVKNVCGPYTGPAIEFGLVRACTMPDGSHWVVQKWKRLMPNGGWKCCRTWEQGRVELHISHFTGDLAKLWLKWHWTTNTTWQGKHLDQLYGRLTWRGRGFYGFSSDRYGNPTDSFGELVYVDTYNSSWGPGWRRINSFLTHNASGGAFCDQLWPNRFGRTNSPGFGQQYRAVSDGPGVTPIVRWLGPPPGNYTPSEGLTRDQLGLFDITGWARHPFNGTQQAWSADEQRALFSDTDRCNKTW